MGFCGVLLKARETIIKSLEEKLDAALATQASPSATFIQPPPHPVKQQHQHGRFRETDDVVLLGASGSFLPRDSVQGLRASLGLSEASAGSSYEAHGIGDRGSQQEQQKGDAWLLQLKDAYKRLLLDLQARHLSELELLKKKASHELQKKQSMVGIAPVFMADLTS